MTAVAFCAKEGRNLYCPAARYGFTTAPQILTTLFRTSGLNIRGDGPHRTLFDVTAVKNSPQMQIRASSNTNGTLKDNFYLTLEDIGIEGNIAGETLRIGENDFSDPVNMPHFVRVFVQNFDTSNACRTVVMNGVLGGKFDIQFFGGSGGYVGGNGIVLTLRQVDFCEFFGSIATAEEAIRFQDGISWGNHFNCLDMENVKTCVRFLGSSGSYQNNTFTGGEWSYSSMGIDCQAGRNNLLINPINNPNSPAKSSDFFLPGHDIGLQIL